MLPKILVCCAALLLAACGKSDENETTISFPSRYAAPELRASVPAPDFIVSEKNTNALFSLEHNLTLTMPHDSVAVRFEAARDACLKDKLLQCTLTSASLTMNVSAGAELRVALPHDKVAIFEKRLLQRLPQDGNGKVEVTSRSTSTENQTQSSADIDRQLTQAVAYRDSLEELGKRPNLTVDEVIKIHSELVDAQAAVDSAEAAKHASDSNIVLEQMNISLQEAVLPPVSASPFSDFWKNAGDVLAASTADMLLRVVNALPWVPIVLVVLILVSRIFRRTRAKPPA